MCAHGPQIDDALLDWTVDMTMTDHRQELAEFLRGRREATRPDQVGLPAGRGRRTPGLRREEVAMLAGVSLTWYTWLEQGRRINASRDVLVAIGRALRRHDATCCGCCSPIRSPAS